MKKIFVRSAARRLGGSSSDELNVKQKIRRMSKKKFMFLLIFLSCFSSLSFAREISARKYNDVVVTIDHPNYGWVYKVANRIVCTHSTGSNYVDIQNIQVLYKGNILGYCTNSDSPYLNGYYLGDEVTSGPVTVTLRSRQTDDVQNVGVYLYDYIALGNSSLLGSKELDKVPGMSSVSANVVDSVTFSELKSGSMASKPLLLPETGTPGKVTITPSLSEDSKGIIQDGEQFSVPYMIDGGEWNEKDGGWVITSTQQSEPHNLIINPDRLKLHPGNYNGYVTVLVAAE